MFYETYLYYKGNYSKNIKSIKYRAYNYFFSQQKNEFDLKEIPGNFDLYFDKEGKLIESYHYKLKKVITKYFYDSNEFDNDLYLIEESIDGNDYSDTLTEFFYDIKNRIALEKISILPNDVVIQRTTLYFPNKKIKFFDNLNDENYSGYNVYKYENEKVTQIEVFTDQKKIVSTEKFSYNKEENSVTKVYNMGEANTKFFGDDDLITDYIFYSNKTKIHRKFTFEKNSKGDWIRQYATDNDVQKFIIEREIEYFSE